MAADVLSPPASDAGRMSRYRSVRKTHRDQLQERAQADPLPPLPAIPSANVQQQQQHMPQTPPKGGPVAGRSASRYRKTTKPRSPGGALSASSSPNNTIAAPVPLALNDQSSRSYRSASSESTSPPQQQSPCAIYRHDTLTQRVEPGTTKPRGQAPDYNETARREQERLAAEEEAERQRQNAEREAQEQADAFTQFLKETAAREADELRMKEEARRSQRQDPVQASPPAERQRSVTGDSPRNRLQRDEKRRPADIDTSEETSVPFKSPPSTSRWGLFNKSKAEDSPPKVLSPRASPPSTANSRPKTSHADSSKPSASFPARRGHTSFDAATADPMPTIKPGGGGIVPGIDAPISAVNADGRRVMVECNSSTMRFPIDPDTTPLQLIRSAANCMSENFDPRSSIMLEVYSKANVQRPLRMYEHVRDVMNSWDNDEQNSLVIVQSGIDTDKELYASWAPQKQPPAASWLMYYSNKPGRWDKRQITLKPEGQLVYDKSNGKETVSICHLSDFDVYSIMPKRLRKVNPKKKHCFAVKSQQKSTMFMDMSSYIHLFATSDQQIADHFHRAVQDWRSWYLSDVMGEGKKPKKNAVAASEVKASLLLPGTTHARAQSVESQYLLGSFNALDLSADSFEYGEDKKQTTRPTVSELKDNEPLGLACSKLMHERKLSQRKQCAPPISFPRTMRSTHDSSRAKKQPKQPSTDFSTDGLLGKEYADRQRAMQARDGDAGGVRVPGASNGGGLARSTSVRSSHTTSARRRSADDGSRPDLPPMPKPLIDLTPQFKEAPQHLRKGRGFKPEQVGSGGLIDAIVTPDDPSGVPNSRDWKRPQTSAGPGARSNFSAGITREKSVRHPVDLYDSAKSLKGHGVKMEVTAAMPAADARRVSIDDGPFTGSGLLGSGGARQGWGAGDKGHGVARGSEAKGPLLDIKEKSQFADGSLLRQMEM